MQEKKLLLLDAYALIFRAFYAMIRNPRVTSTGIDTSAIFGFVNMLQDLLKRERPTHIAVCFDPAGKTFRHDEYPDYKANRDKTPEGILVAVPYIKRILEAYRIPVIVVDGYEADDVIGTMAHRAQEHGFFTYMVTGDKDFAQLVTDHVKIFNPGKNEVLGVDEVKQKYGLQSPLQVIDMLGLMGDTADNIPGCPGVGPKTAEKLIQQFGSVENMLLNTDQIKGALRAKVEDNAEQIKFSKYLATIKTDVPIDWDEEALRREPADLEALRQVFNELEFRTLATRIIDQQEANVGLEQCTMHHAQSTMLGSQLSLFDEVQEPATESEQPSSPGQAPLETQHSIPEAQLMSDTYAADKLVKQLLRQEQVGLCLVSDGDEAMRGTMVGMALCGDTTQVHYLPLDAMGFMLQVIEPLFAGTTRIVTNDVKRLMVMLSAAGITMTAPYYDTGVAHYLLQPERTHATTDIAADLLHYDAITNESVFGAKGRKQLMPSQVPPEKMTRWAGEQAALNLALQPVLDQQLAAEGLTHLLTDIEHPLVAVLARMELAGARIDIKALHDYSLALLDQVHTLEEECQELAGEPFNTASPAQVGQILFDKLQLDPKAKKTKTGQYVTSEEVLESLRAKHPAVEKILAYRGLKKLLGTYIDALPLLINPETGHIHTSFNQTVAATGRLSSSNPNLQNIPVRDAEGKEVRKAFIPEPGQEFFSADYSQIELRIMAHLSQDEHLIEAFRSGYDIHAATAAKIFHKPIEEVTSDERRRAKTANFGIIYGISAFGLAERLGCSRTEAKELIDGYFLSYPKVREYMDKSIAMARERGYTETLFHRRLVLPDINSHNSVVRGYAERNAINAPIQGTAADIIKIAMVRVYRRLVAEGFQSKMILQVHDELNFTVVPEEKEHLQQMVIEEMQAACQLSVPLVADCGWGTNWLEAH